MVDNPRDNKNTMKNRLTNMAQVAKNSLHLRELLQRQQTVGLSPSETSELNRYLQLERLLALAQRRARAQGHSP